MIEITREPGSITVRGHAKYAPRGADIVCAGVSALAFALIGSLEELTEDSPEVVIERGYMQIKHGNLSEQGKLLTDSFFVGVRQIAEAYPSNVVCREAGPGGEDNKSSGKAQAGKAQ